jgi:undecaprenyl-diphosphatase
MEMFNFPKSPLLKLFFVGISQLSLYITIVGSPMVIIWYTLRSNKRNGYFILVVMFGSVLIWELFNILISWPRPQTSITLTQSYSYPSGHVLVGVCFYLSLALTINDSMDDRYKKIFVWIIPVIIIAMISVSRMYLRAHYPTDIIAGIIIGIIWLLMVVLYFDKIEVLLIRMEIFLGRTLNIFIKTRKQYVKS